MSLEDWTWALKQIEDTVSPAHRDKYRSDVLRRYVRAWVDFLGWPREVVHDAMRMQSELEHRLASTGLAVIKTMLIDKKIRSSLDKVIAHFRPDRRGNFLWNKRTSKQATTNDGGAKTMETKEYILLALLLAAAAYAAWTAGQKRQQAREREELRRREAAKAASETYLLVLVINAKHETTINALRNGTAHDLESDALYQSTQALWFGTESEMKQANFMQWFDESSAVENPSEYDVHLVRMTIDRGAKNDPGFRRDANDIDRLDALKYVQNSKVNATVSPRLPSEAYGTSRFFQR